MMKDAQQLFGRLLSLPGLDVLHRTGTKVMLKKKTVDLFQGLLDRSGLMEDVDAVGIFFNHAADFLEMSFNGSEASRK